MLTKVHYFFASSACTQYMMLKKRPLTIYSIFQVCVCVCVCVCAGKINDKNKYIQSIKEINHVSAVSDHG